MLIYCMKCRGKSDTKDMKPHMIKNRIQVKGSCAKCGCKKCQFISKDNALKMHQGGALNLGNILNLLMPQFSPDGFATPLMAGLNLI